MAAQPIGDRPAFPHTPGTEGDAQGMTYRQWLIGMAVANGKIGMQAIETADLVLRALEKDQALSSK